MKDAPIPECGKCGSLEFEAAVQTINNLNTELVFVVCKSCNAAVGILDITTAGRVRDIENDLKRIKRKLG